MAGDDAFYAAAERRIEYLTIVLGVLGGVWAGVVWGMRAGIGVALGAMLSWVNFRWMKEGVGALARLSKGQQIAEKVRVPKSVYFRFIGRYTLLVVPAYVTVKYFGLPVVSLLVGFGAVGIAALLEVIGQLFRGQQIPDAHS